MFGLIIVTHVIFCVFLILVILLQTGKGAGMGAAFGGSSSQTVFGPRGAGSFVGKLTGVVAGLFMLTSLLLVYMSSSTSTGIEEKVAALKEERAAVVQPVAVGEPAQPAAADADEDKQAPEATEAGDQAATGNPAAEAPAKPAAPVPAQAPAQP